MDENKLKVLKKIEYQRSECCGNCIWSKFQKFPKSLDFGECRCFKYKHLKHSDKTRNLSIYRYGTCKYYVDCIRPEAEEFLSSLE